MILFSVQRVSVEFSPICLERSVNDPRWMAALGKKGKLIELGSGRTEHK